MDYDKLIEDMREIACKNSVSLYKRGRCADAATAIETLRADLRRVETERDTLLSANQHLLAEREQLTAERDAAIEWIQQFTETIDRPCAACKHNNEQDLKTYCKGCGSMGAPSCIWEWRGIKEG